MKVVLPSNIPYLHESMMRFPPPYKPLILNIREWEAAAELQLKPSTRVRVRAAACHTPITGPCFLLPLTIATALAWVAAQSGPGYGAYRCFSPSWGMQQLLLPRPLLHGQARAGARATTWSICPCPEQGQQVARSDAV